MNFSCFLHSPLRFASVLLLFSSLSAATNAAVFSSVTSGDIDDACTWDASCSVGTPGASDDIIINSGHTVNVVLASRKVTNVTINSGGVLNIATSTYAYFAVLGNLVNNGTVQGVGGLAFKGSPSTMSGSGLYYEYGPWAVYTGGDLTIASGANAYKRYSSVVIYSGQTLTNQGTLRIAGQIKATGTTSTLTNDANATLIIDGELFPVTSGVLNASASGNLVKYVKNGGTQSIVTPSGGTYYHLKASLPGTKQMQGNLTVNGDLTVYYYSTLDAANKTLTVKGNMLVDLGTATTANLGMVTFDGSGAQSITNNLSSTQDFPGGLTIGASSILTTNNNLSIGGDLIMNGTFNLGTYLLTMNGSGAQNIANNTSGLFSLTDLTINKSGGTATLTAGTFALSGILTVSGGAFDPAGRMTLKSKPSQTARIAPVTGGGSFAGDLIVERYLSSRSNNWADFGPPVSSTTVGDWDKELYMSGVGGDDGDACCPVFKSVYRYDGATQTWVAYNDTSTSITGSNGIELYLGGAGGNLSNTTMNSIGVPVYGDQTISINNNGDWNLVGNPFASFVSWDAVSAASPDATGTMKVLTNGAYVDHSSGSGFEIPPHQGFWVQSAAGGGQLHVNETHKTTTTSSTFYKTTQPQYLLLELASTLNNYRSQLHIIFREDAEMTYQPGYHDASFLKSRVEDAPFLYTESDDGIKLSQRAVNFDRSHLTMPLYIESAPSGELVLSASGFDYVGDYSCIYLEDLQTGEMVDLKKTSDHAFEFASSEPVKRFMLHLYRKTACRGDMIQSVAQETPGGSTTAITPTERGIEVQFGFKSKEDARISVYNALGQLLYSKECPGVRTETVVLHPQLWKDQIALIRVGSPSGTVSRKFIH